MRLMVPLAMDEKGIAVALAWYVSNTLAAGICLTGTVLTAPVTEPRLTTAVDSTSPVTTDAALTVSVPLAESGPPLAVTLEEVERVAPAWTAVLRTSRA